MLRPQHARSASRSPILSVCLRCASAATGVGNTPLRKRGCRANHLVAPMKEAGERNRGAKGFNPNGGKQQERVEEGKRRTMRCHHDGRRTCLWRLPWEHAHARIGVPSLQVRRRLATILCASAQIPPSAQMAKERQRTGPARASTHRAETSGRRAMISRTGILTKQNPALPATPWLRAGRRLAMHV